MALITDAWKVYMAEAVVTDDIDCVEERVDHYWWNCLSREISPGQVQVFYSSEACQKSCP